MSACRWCIVRSSAGRADAALATLIAKDEKDAPYNIVNVYAFRGDADKAFEWLDKAVVLLRSGTHAKSQRRTCSTRSI